MTAEGPELSWALSRLPLATPQPLLFTWGISIVMRQLFVSRSAAGSSGSSTLSDVWIFNTAGGSWSQPALHGPIPTGREMHSAVMVDATHMLVFGGRAGDGRWEAGGKVDRGGTSLRFEQSK